MQSRSRGAGMPITGGRLLECDPATWEAPDACFSFPAVIVDGQSGALMCNPVASFGSLPPSVTTAGDVCSSGGRMVFSATLRNTSAWNSSGGRKNIEIVSRNISIESNSLWGFQLLYSVLLTQSLVKNKNVTREQHPSLVIPGWCLWGRYQRRCRHAEDFRKVSNESFWKLKGSPLVGSWT